MNTSVQIKEKFVFGRKRRLFKKTTFNVFVSRRKNDHKISIF